MCPICARRYLRCHCNTRRYGCLGFLFDSFMVVITGGLWLIRIYVREMRKR